MHEQEPAATRTREVATTPEDLATLFQRYMTDGDLDGLVSLYEPEATFQPEPGHLVSGTDAIRESLGGYVDAKALNLRAIRVVGDLALLQFGRSAGASPQRRTAEGDQHGGREAAAGWSMAVRHTRPVLRPLTVGDHS